MKIEYITIDAGQRFDAVMPEIPTNSIINKTVTGCGATYAEINAPRHSVIIVMLHERYGFTAQHVEYGPGLNAECFRDDAEARDCALLSPTAFFWLAERAFHVSEDAFFKVFPVFKGTPGWIQNPVSPSINIR